MDDSLKIFISYSRNDSAFVDQLVRALEMFEFEILFDRESLVGGEDWRSRLSRMISDSDTVLFILSPDSVNSDICAWEIGEADRLGKRIVPVLARPLDSPQAPPNIARLNFVRFDFDGQGAGFGDGLKNLVDVLRTDMPWIQTQTRLSSLASEWEARDRPEDWLLRGPDLKDAQQWLNARPATAPAPTDSVSDFIQASTAFAASHPSAEIAQPAPGPRGRRIFISYRRKDAPFVAGRICDRLERDFSKEDVFFDVDTIPLGSKFRDVIAEYLRQSAILLVVIGGDWVNPEWRRSPIGRWFSPTREDYVQTEIELAFEVGIPIVPILVAGVEMPSKTSLPASLRELCDLHAATVRAGRDFHVDMGLICEKIRDLRSSI